MIIDASMAINDQVSTVSMTELRKLVEARIMRSLGIPRRFGKLGACYGHSVGHPAIDFDFYTYPGDRVLVDGFEREHVLFGITGAKGYAVQLVYHAGKPVFDWKRARIKRRIIEGVVIYIKRPN